MRRRKLPGSSPIRVGLAYAAYVPDFVLRRPGLIDFVEIPFERLCHDPATASVLDLLPAILHCASLSVAGVVEPPEPTIRRLREWASRTGTPWIGEHLSFVRAPGDDGIVLDVGYTVAPPLNASTLERVIAACKRYEVEIAHPIILENPPQYFTTPGSTMDQASFLTALCSESDIHLLLDLSHLLITSRNTGRDVDDLVNRLPLHRVREIHLSGFSSQHSVCWDDHGVRADDAAFELLSTVIGRTPATVVTLEYNWAGDFGDDAVIEDLERIRRVVERAAA